MLAPFGAAKKSIIFRGVCSVTFASGLNVSPRFERLSRCFVRHNKPVVAMQQSFVKSQSFVNSVRRSEFWGHKQRRARPPHTTTYTLTCLDLTGATETKTATVNIIPTFYEI
jgi:hypothetical protein